MRKIAVYLTYFHHTRTNSVLKFRILLITESSVLRKGSFPIIGQHFYHLFLLEKLFSHETHNKIIFKVTSFFSFFYEFFALFLHSSFCIYSDPFSAFFVHFSKLFFTCKEVIRHNNNSRIFLFYMYNSM